MEWRNAVVPVMSEEGVEHVCEGQTLETEGNRVKSKMDRLEHLVVPKKEGDDDVETVYSETFVKEEVDEPDSVEQPIDETLLMNGTDPSSEQSTTKDDTLVGKLKVRPFASLAEPVQPTPSFHQSNLYNEGTVPQAHQGFPPNPAFPHERKSPTDTKKTGTKKYLTNSGITELYTKNQGLQFLLNNNCYPDRGNFPHLVSMLGRHLSKKFPVKSAPLHRPVRIPTLDISIPNSYSPSVPLKPFEPPSMSLTMHRQLSSYGSPILSSGQTSTVPSSSDLKSSSLLITSSPLENVSTVSATNGPMEEEIKSESTLNSSEMVATDVSLVNSLPIVKYELDLGVSTGEKLEQHDSSNPHNPTNPSTSKNMDTIATTELDSGLNLENRHEQSTQNNETSFLTSDFSSKLMDAGRRYKDVDPEDLLPESNPRGKRLCRYCDYRHNSEDVMKNHKMKLHSKKYSFRCFLCVRRETLKLSSRDFLEHHVATFHRGEKRFQCKKCGRSFTNKKGHKNHKKNICLIIDPFACHLCTFTCQTMSALENHLLKHDETIEECSICLKKVKKSLLTKHMYQHNKPRKDKVCEKCDFVTSSKAQMVAHYRITRHNKKFQCPLCKYACNCEESYANHVKTCDNKTPPYTCTFPACGREFSMRQMYVAHLPVHTYPGRSVFRCPDKDCGYETVINATLVKHMKLRNHHRQFRCPDCPLRFSMEKSLADHIQRVHVENIIKNLGFPLQDEDHDSNVDLDQEDEDDPYAHFKRGWLGMSCTEQEESTVNLQPGELNTGFDQSSAVETSHELVHDVPEFTHVIPEISCMVECSHDTSEFSDQTSDRVKLEENELHCDTESHATMIVTPNINFLNTGFEGEDKTNMDVVNHISGVSATDVGDLTIKSDPDLNYESSEIKCSENIIVTPSLDLVQNQVDSSANQITLNCSGESSIQAEEFTIKSDPDSSENIVTPSILLFPGMESEHFEIENQADCIQPDNEELPVGTTSDSAIITSEQ